MSTSNIAHVFAKTYYTRLSSAPELAHRFYGNESTVLHGTEGDLESTVISGRAAIKARFSEDHYKNTVYLIRDVTAVASVQDSFLVIVLGELAKKDANPQQFSQTFVLVPAGDGALYIASDVQRVFNPDFDAAVEPATGAVDEVRELAENVSLQDSEADESMPAPAPKPNSWAAVLAQPPLPAAPKTAARPAATPAAPGTVPAASAAPRGPGPYSAFLKLSSPVAITKPVAAKALAQFGPIANLQLDPAKKRGYVDFPNQHMFDRAMKTGRVKIPGGRESIEIQKRFKGPPLSSKPEGRGPRAQDRRDHKK